MLESLRNEQLIEERLAYEEEYFSIDDMFLRDIEKSEEMDIQITQYLDDGLPYREIDYYMYFDDVSYPSYYCMEEVYDPYYDDDFIDYPEGPDENLNGYNPYSQQEFYEPYEEMDFDDYSPIDEYDDSIDREELHIQNLIEERLAEEREFMESILLNSNEVLFN